MKRTKALARLQRRQKAWDNAPCNNEKYHGLFGERPGFKRPGSFKKPHPKGRR